MEFNSTEELIKDIKSGKMVILLDDEDRENEGDLVCAADCVTPEIINFMVSKGRGLVCLTLSPEKCDQLNLPMMTNYNRTKHGTAFTVSIEAANGISTGSGGQFPSQGQAQSQRGSQGPWRTHGSSCDRRGGIRLG